jgi:hypothetical protein
MFAGFMINLISSEFDVKTHSPCQIPLDLRALGISPDVRRKTNQPCQQSKEYILSEVSSSYGGEFEVQICLLGCTAV